MLNLLRIFMVQCSWQRSGLSTEWRGLIYSVNVNSKFIQHNFIQHLSCTEYTIVWWTKLSLTFAVSYRHCMMGYGDRLAVHSRSLGSRQIRPTRRVIGVPETSILNVGHFTSSASSDRQPHGWRRRKTMLNQSINHMIMKCVSLRWCREWSFHLVNLHSINLLTIFLQRILVIVSLVQFQQPLFWMNLC